MKCHLGVPPVSPPILQRFIKFINYTRRHWRGSKVVCSKAVLLHAHPLRRIASVTLRRDTYYDLDAPGVGLPEIVAAVSLISERVMSVTRARARVASRCASVRLYST